MLEINKIYNMDCLNGMKLLNNQSIDLIITSPPYNIEKKYIEYNDNQEQEEYINWLIIRIKEFERILKPHGSLWLNVGYRKLKNGNIPITYQLYSHISLFLNQEIVWEYGAGLTYKSRFNHRSERWMWYIKDSNNYIFKPDEVRDINLTKYKKDKRNNPNGKLPGDVWYFPHIAGNFKEREKHPAQFPENMIERIIKSCSNENDLILDPFMGSGTTAKAAKSNNRNYIGFDISKEYCDIAKNRIK